MTDKLNWSVIAEKVEYVCYNEFVSNGAMTQVSDTSSVKRTAEECKIKWIGELSTAVNRGPWKPPEVQKLQQIVKSKANQTVNWVEVSKALGVKIIHS